MNQAIRAIIIPGIAVLLSSGCLAQVQKTISNPDGSKEVLDTSTGWTEIDNGKTTNVSAADFTSFCGSLETAAKYQLKDTGGVRIACDEWAKLQPQTQIQKVSFSRLVTRLLEISPPYTDFARYRGYELKSEGKSTIYDVTIVPDDIGPRASCTIEEEGRSQGWMLYTYQCSVKTSSYPDAVRLKDHLAQLLSSLDLTEDQIREHGLAAHAREVGRCAPSGECLEEHVYATAMKEGKTLQIEANPDFTRNTMAELNAMQYGGIRRLRGLPPTRRPYPLRFSPLARSNPTVWRRAEPVDRLIRSSHPSLRLQVYPQPH